MKIHSMDYFEHKLDMIQSQSCLGLDHDRLLKERSSEGWELVSTVSYSIFKTEYINLYWKRKKRV